MFDIWYLLSLCIGTYMLHMLPIKYCTQYWVPRKHIVWDLGLRYNVAEKTTKGTVPLTKKRTTISAVALIVNEYESSYEEQ